MACETEVFAFTEFFIDKEVFDPVRIKAHRCETRKISADEIKQASVIGRLTFGLQYLFE
jgi:hypothetical protein